MKNEKNQEKKMTKRKKKTVVQIEHFPDPCFQKLPGRRDFHGEFTEFKTIQGATEKVRL